MLQISSQNFKHPAAKYRGVRQGRKGSPFYIVVFLMILFQQMSCEKKKIGLDPRLMKHSDGAVVGKPVPLLAARPENIVVKQEPV